MAGQHRCAHPQCPGYTWRASDMPHPCPQHEDTPARQAVGTPVPADPGTRHPRTLELLRRFVAAWNATETSEAMDMMADVAAAFEAEDSGTPAPADPGTGAPTNLAVHVLNEGRALCGKPGVPGEWGPGHKWVARDHDDYGDRAEINCDECLAAYDLWKLDPALYERISRIAVRLAAPPEPTNLAGDSLLTIMAALLQRWWLVANGTSALRDQTRIVLERLTRDGRGQVSAAQAMMQATDMLLAQYLLAHPHAMPSKVGVLELMHWAKDGDANGS